jgi:hypothetical protein
MRHVLIASVLLLLFPLQAAAEWQFKPFVGLTFGGATTFIDLEDAAGTTKICWGGNAAYVGEIFGIEGDFGTTPGFFQSNNYSLADLQKVYDSAVTTLTGNIVVAWPRHRAEYTLRPYLVAGGGLVRVRIDDRKGPLVTSNQSGFDVGGGATGFLTKRVGVSWDLRYFRSIAGTGQGGGISFDQPGISFWRLSMAVAVRY